MSDYQVIVPSYKRAGLVKSAKLFRAHLVQVWVPVSQVDAYVNAQPELTVIGIPDDADGRGMAVKRNYILDHALADRVVMVDDDVRDYKRWHGNEQRTLDVDGVDAMIQEGFDLAAQLRAPIWSPNIKADTRAYSKMRPFSLLSPVLGPFTGAIRSIVGSARYDTRFRSKEDYDFWLSMIERHRRTLRLNQFAFIKKEEATGGLTRSFEAEKAEAELIQRKWGRVIRYTIKAKSVLDGTVHLPIPGC